MNKKRRKEIARIAAKVEEAFEALTAIAEEEREAFENLPESLQYGERGEAMSEAAETLETAASELETVRDSLSGLAGGD
jgi:hypothetical protein